MNNNKKQNNTLTRNNTDAKNNNVAKNNSSGVVRQTVNKTVEAGKSNPVLALVILIVVLVPLPSNLSLGYWNLIHITHYLIFLPWLLYIAYQQKVNPDRYETLFITGVIIVIYHAYKAWIRRDML